MTNIVNKKKRPRLKAALDLASIGRRIRELRGFDTEQKDFARILGTSQSQLSKYERGVIEPPLRLLVRLKEHFGKSLDWFVEGDR